MPGTDRALVYERDAAGGLLRLSAGDTVYLEYRDGRLILGDGLAEVREATLPRAVLRQVRAAGRTWTEVYRWDGSGRLVHVDGVDVERDERHRVTRCAGAGGEWRYRYEGDRLAAIAGPAGERRLEHGAEGRPELVCENGSTREVAYDRAGRRRDASAAPAGWSFDELGRLWTIAGPGGRIEATFLWDGFACIGRIDGPPGEPLAAAFSLDPSLTPVRIVTAERVVRVPRDAFGESLLGHRKVPGLYGGAVHHRLVQLKQRTLDPALGAFDRPDPFHGGLLDPRREQGFEGPLWVDSAAAGPYAVCQHDAVGRADPTGGISVGLLLSDLTWSYQNNVASWLGFQFVINQIFFTLYLLLEAFSFGHFDPGRGSFFSNASTAFSWSGLSAVSHDQWGVRVGGVLSPDDQAWTYQHLVMTQPTYMRDYRAARLFDPQGEFRPNLYGTLLQVVPDDGAPILLRGSRPTPVALGRGWTRAGGRAEPVIPGSRVPFFPSGAFHFDDTYDGTEGRPLVESPQGATLRDLVPGEVIGTGTLDSAPSMVLLDGAQGMVADDLVLLTEPDVASAIVRIVSLTEIGGEVVLAGQTVAAPALLELDASAATLEVGSEGLVLDRLGAPDQEVLPGVEPNLLDLPGSAAEYAAGNALRLSQGGEVVGSSTIARLEARLDLDQTLNGLAQPLTLVVADLADPAAAPENAVVAAATQLDFTGGPVPAEGDMIEVTDGVTTVGVVITGNPGGDLRDVDRDLLALGLPAGAVNWRALIRGAVLGRRADAPEAEARVTYAPDSLRTAPAGGFLRAEAGDGTVAVRTVTGRAYDAVVLHIDLPGDAAAPYDVERFDLVEPHVTGLRLGVILTLELDPEVALEGPVLQLSQFLQDDLAALPITPVVNVGAIADAVARGPVAAGGLSVSQLVVLTDAGGGRELAYTRRLRETYTLDRDLDVAADTVELVTLEGAGHNYNARHLGTVTVEDAAGTLVVAAGDDVELDWQGAANQFRVSEVDGTTLVLVGGGDQQAQLTDAVANVAPVVIVPDDAGLMVTVLPEVTVDGNAVRSHMPSFSVGELVQVVWGGVEQLRVAAVDGGNRFTLENPADPDALSLPRIRRLQPANPNNGGTRVGLSGALVANRDWAFDVLASGAADDAVVGVVDDEATLPAVVTGVAGDLEVELAAAPGINVTAINDPADGLVGTRLAPSYAQDGSTVRIPLETLSLAPLSAPSENLTVAVPFRPGEVTRRGQLGTGTTLVPERLGAHQLDRPQSLIDHELWHTRQCQELGPVLLAYTPLWLIELAVEGMARLDWIRDLDLPAFSEFVDGRVVDGGQEGKRFLSVAGSGYSQRDRVQIAYGRSLASAVLGPPSEHGYLLDSGEVPLGDVRVRRQNNSCAWDVIYTFLKTTTVGGVVNNLAITTYGGLIFGIYKIVQAIVRSRTKSVKATVDADSRFLTVPNSNDLLKVQRASFITIEADDQPTIVRGVERLSTFGGEVGEPGAQGRVELKAPCGRTGEVEIATYSLSGANALWDWHDYYPARLPDRQQLHTIEVLRVGSERLELEPLDAVTVTMGEQSKRTSVTARVGPDTYELEHPVLFEGLAGGEGPSEAVLLIAKVGENDPLGGYESFVINNFLGMGWLRWVTDPWGNLEYRVETPADEARESQFAAGVGGVFAEIFLRLGRYAFGTRSWTMLPPLFGEVFHDNFYRRANSHLAWMEQTASENSGNLYSPLGRLKGPAHPGDLQDLVQSPLAYVGDIGTYWFFDADNHTGTVVEFGRGDAPGANLRDRPRVVPSLHLTAVAEDDSGEPNLRSGVDAAVTDPGLDVPDVFFIKDADPRAARQTGPPGFRSTNAGLVPWRFDFGWTSQLQKTVGAYVAFSRPPGGAAGLHRLTVANGIGQGEEGREAQENDARWGDGPAQRLFFERSPRDVTVTLAGAERANSDAVTLLRTQQVRLGVSPNGDRRYAASLLRPAAGDVLRLEEDLLLVARGRSGSEPVEVCRIYRYDAASDSFDSGELQRFGLHLPRDVRIPVRLLEIEVVDVLPVVAALPAAVPDTLYDDPPAPLAAGGEVFVLVASSVRDFDAVAAFTGGPPAPVTAPRPVIADATADAGETLRAFLGAGAAFRVSVAAADPPEEPAEVTFSVEVGTDGNTADLAVAIPLAPHFQLVDTGGGFSVSAGDSLVVRAESGGTPLDVTSPVVTPAAGVTPTVAGAEVTLAVAPGTAPGVRQLLVTSSADPAQRARRTFQIVP